MGDGGDSSVSPAYPPSDAGPPTRGLPRLTNSAAQAECRAAPGSVSATPSRLFLRGRDPQYVTETADCVDQPRLRLVDLTPQVAQARLERVVVAGRVVLPDLVQYLVLADHPPGVHHQEPQQAVLGGCQRDQGAGPPDLVRVLVELEVGDAQPRTGSIRPGAFQYRPDAAEQLL